MSDAIQAKIVASLKLVVKLLVSGLYHEIESLTIGRRLQAGHIEQGVTDFGERLIMPPDEAFDQLDVIQVEGRDPAEYSVRFHLYTQAEGKSDLSLELTLIDRESASAPMTIEFDNIHVF